MCWEVPWLVKLRSWLRLLQACGVGCRMSAAIGRGVGYAAQCSAAAVVGRIAVQLVSCVPGLGKSDVTQLQLQV